MKRFGRIAFGIVISLLALWIILYQVDLARVQQSLRQANYWWMIPAAVVLVVSNFARAKRWQVLLEDKLTVIQLFWITNIGYLLSNVLPFRLGELGRVYLASRGGEVNGMQALSTGILERLIDVLVVVAFMAAILPLAPDRGLVIQVAGIAAAVAFVGITGLFVASFLRDWVVRLATLVVNRIRPALVAPLVGRLDSFLLAIVAARQGSRLWRALFWSVVIWMLSSLTTYLVLLGFVPGAPLYVGVFVTAAAALGLGLPSSPAGVGVFEGAVVAALLVFSISESAGFAYALALHLVNFAVIGALGVIGLEVEKVGLREVAISARGIVQSLRPVEGVD